MNFDKKLVTLLPREGEPGFIVWDVDPATANLPRPFQVCENGFWQGMDIFRYGSIRIPLDEEEEGEVVVETGNGRKIFPRFLIEMVDSDREWASNGMTIMLIAAALDMILVEWPESARSMVADLIRNSSPREKLASHDLYRDHILGKLLARPYRDQQSSGQAPDWAVMAALNCLYFGQWKIPRSDYNLLLNGDYF